MKAERLIYTFVSLAYHADSFWGHGVAVEGVERTASVAHKHGIPVTWIVDGKSSMVLGDSICKWHEEYGDDVILRWIINEGDDREKVKKDLETAWQELKKFFPWIKTKVAARGKYTSEMIQILEELDFKGLWGYCWEQSWWDDITHKGIPWGLWYIDKERYKAPAQTGGKVVACEWTARDLNQAWLTGSPCIYSSDPDDVYRAGLCTGDNIEYWKKLFLDYLNNTKHNEFVYFSQQQESHEMENTASFAVWPVSQIKESEKMLDSFFEFIKGFDITISTLPEAIEHYHGINQATAPSYMLVKDSDIRPATNKYTMTLGGVGMGPWPEAFLYYDRKCQLAFVKGEYRPRMLRNYTGNSKSGDVFDEDIPFVFIEERSDTSYIKSDNCIDITFTVEASKPVPFGLAYWDDLTGFKVKVCDGAESVKIIDNKLAFIRIDLNGERQLIHLVLTRRHT